MLVFASDYVGFRSLEILLSKRIAIRGLVLHRRDPGNFNAKMIALHADELAQIGVPLNFHDECDRIVSSNLTAERPELGLLAWWPDIIRQPLLSVPRRGWINFHPSYLPFNRGKHPNFWCLAERTPCGVALHFATSSIDAGDIVAREQLPVSWEDTGATIYARSQQLILELFSANIENIVADRILRTRQDPSEGTFHRAAEIEAASRIDLDRHYRARDLLNIVRARMFKPHPTAFFMEGGKKYSIEVIIKKAETDSHG